MVSGLNHITLAVSDLTRSFHFYSHFLGLKPIVKWDRGAYLTAGEMWFCLSQGTAHPAQDYSHICFSVTADILSDIRKNLEAEGIKQWQTNTSEGESCYILDPDGHKLEIHVGDLNSRLQSLRQHPYDGLQWYI